MRPRDFALQLDPDGRVPLFRRLARALVLAIRQGRLAPGQALPGTRALAEATGANRKTVISAVQELEAEGWVVTEPNQGSFVADPLPEDGVDWDCAASPREPMVPAALPGFDVPSRLHPLSAQDSGALVLSEGLPDPALAPSEALAKAYQRALRRHGKELLGYGEPGGNAQLRQALAAWLSERRGLRAHPEQILVTRGNRAALTLLALALFKEGDLAGIENPGNPQVRETLSQCQAIRLHAVPVDEEGIDSNHVEILAAKERLKALYLTPQRQYPTTVPLSPARRSRLLELARTHRFAIIEDDQDADYTFGESAPLPLASKDPEGSVIYLMSLSRLLAPGMRLGCLVAPAQLVDRLARFQRSLDWQGDRVVEWAVADLIRDGDLANHLRKARKVYQARMEHLVSRLREALGAHLQMDAPAGGLALWMKISEGIDAEAWITAARIRGLILHLPSHFYAGTPEPFTRMGFAQADEAALDEAVRRLAQALEDLRR